MRHKSWYQLDCTWNRGTDGGGVGDGLCNTFAWLQKRHGGQNLDGRRCIGGDLLEDDLVV